jgi:hypothetical protein
VQDEFLDHLYPDEGFNVVRHERHVPSTVIRR